MPQQPPAPPLWTRFASGQVSEAPSLARVKSGVLHVAWREGGNLLHSTIVADGKPATGPATSVGTSQSTPWLAAAPDGALLQVLFFAQGSLHAATSKDSGASWSRAAVNGPQPGANFAIAPDKDGKPVIISAEKGQLTLLGGAEPQRVQEGPCCLDRPALALDVESAEGWAAWYQDTPKATGLFARAVKPLGSKAQLAPGSQAAGRTQRLPLTARLGVPGVYLAYLAGPAVAREVKLWNVRGGEALTIAKAPGARHVWLAPAPDGRLWILWMNGNGTVSAVRSNKALLRFSKPYTLGKPSVDLGGIPFLIADGAKGPLDVISGAFHTRLLPTMEVSASPQGIRVADLGEPVDGVDVEIGGKKITTDLKGLAAYPITAGTPPPPMKATHPAYAPTATYTVK